MSIQSQVNQKQEFNKLLAKYKALNKGNVRMTQSSLFLSLPISNQKTNYLFPVIDSDQPAQFLPLDRRLNINDEFIVTEMGLYILGEITDPEQPDLVNAWRYFTTPLLETDIAFLTQENLYNGDISISVNNIKFMEKWDTRKHQYIPVTQTQASSVGMPFTTLPNGDFSTVGMSTVSPMITLSGAKKNEISLNLPAPIDSINTPIITLGTSGTGAIIKCSRIGLKFHGFLAQNAAKVQ